jgi:tol-pal system protein YbgF
MFSLPMISSKPFSARSSRAGRASALLAMLLAAPGFAMAQGFESEQLPAVKGEKPAPQKPGAGSASANADGGGLRQRVEQLEGQIVDLQVVIGTLESLARTGGTQQPAPIRSEASGNLGSGDQARLDTIETQIRALTSQVEALANEMRAGGVQRRSDAGVPAGAPDAAPGFGGGNYETDRFGSTTVTSDDKGFAPGGRGFSPGGAAPGGPPAASQQPAAPSTYGSESLPPPPGGAPTGVGDQVAAADPMAGGSAKEVYETAYGHLLQQDYATAQTGFRSFLKTYPQDPLAPNALYWLGESHYVQRNYADAAEAFDLVVQAYASSGKAPDAQLKRGMSLAALGKRQDACTALRSVSSKFPSAPALLKSKADSERQRIGCP